MDVWVYFDRKEEKCRLWRIVGSELFTLLIKKDRLRWFGHAQCKDDVVKQP